MNNMMKKALSHGLALVLIVGVVAVAGVFMMGNSGNNNLTGNIVNSPSLLGQKEQKSTSKLNVAPSQSEICDNNVDDNGNGKIDCQEKTCAGFMVFNSNKLQTICTSGKRFTCGANLPSFGILNIKEFGFDVLCIGSKDQSYMRICNANDKLEGNYQYSDVDKNGISGNLPILCTELEFGGKKYESYVQCGGKKAGPDGVQAKIGDSYGEYKCTNVQKKDTNGNSFNSVTWTISK